MWVYLAGPMRGYPDFNFPAFHAAAVKLRAAGHYVFSPAERDENEFGFGALKSATGDLADIASLGFDLRKALKHDLVWICQHADAIACLPGWEGSSGARAERAVGEALGLIILELE